MSLVQKNQITKYLAYAVGEIFLVVVGILIALQINTWNEERKLKNYELKMLHELRNTLEKDKRYFSNQIPRLNNKQNAANRLLEFRQTKEENLDTLNQYFSALRYEVLFQYNSGTYGSIKSGGIDKISNDSIRSQMADLYEFIIPRTEKIFERINSDESVENDLVEQITSRMIVTLSNNEQSIQNKISDPKVIYKDEFLHLIQIQKNSTFIFKSRIENLIPALDNLIGLIERELIRQGDEEILDSQTDG
ncbi:hypothetical protein E4S40_15560 [Algoriphagus kandeliae]|uniref:Uncharacterized protein n=1 Tax=Algoriphagus kandeliae TaxID=2562278 RepID=A0A4Y9QLV4_9BACT|nr:DUF6090 family protein [Algoriphagus kandeliae]TFV93659.1 hypothetical protein E4S40_15560 [Algoriphagus kandeliae]